MLRTVRASSVVHYDLAPADDPADIEGCRALWRRVMEVGIEDAIGQESECWRELNNADDLEHYEKPEGAFEWAEDTECGTAPGTLGFICTLFNLSAGAVLARIESARRARGVQ